MFKCKVCAEKDRRIADLQHMIKLLQPQEGNGIPIVNLEANRVLDGQDDVIVIPHDEDQVDQAETELNRILAATY